MTKDKLQAAMDAQEWFTAQHPPNDYQFQNKEHVDWQKTIQAALKHYAASLEDDGWLPIETAPKDGVGILVHQGVYEDGDIQATAYFCARQEQWCLVDFRISCGEDGEMFLSPTHWRPLPPPPTQAQEDLGEIGGV